MPTCRPGRGTVLQLSVASSYMPIAQVVDITGPGAEIGTREVTNLSSTAAEFYPTILDPGEVTANIFYDPAELTHADLTNLLTTPTTASWKIVFPTTTFVISFGGSLTTFEQNGMDVEGTLGASLTITLTGAITWPSTA